MISKRSGELEYKLRFADLDDFNKAVEWEQDEFGGRVASVTVERPTIFLDTVDQDLYRNKCSFALVLNSGFGRQESKFVLKLPTVFSRIRDEVIYRIPNTNLVELLNYNYKQIIELNEVLDNSKITQIHPQVLIVQKRYKRTVLLDNIPVYLSYDFVRYYNWKSQMLIGTYYFAEIEIDSMDPESNELLEKLVEYHTRNYRVTEFRKTKYEIGIELNLETSISIRRVLEKGVIMKHIDDLGEGLKAELSDENEVCKNAVELSNVYAKLKLIHILGYKDYEKEFEKLERHLLRMGLINENGNLLSTRIQNLFNQEHILEKGKVYLRDYNLHMYNKDSRFRAQVYMLHMQELSNLTGEVLQLINNEKNVGNILLRTFKNVEAISAITTQLFDMLEEMRKCFEKLHSVRKGLVVDTNYSLSDLQVPIGFQRISDQFTYVELKEVFVKAFSQYDDTSYIRKYNEYITNSCVDIYPYPEKQHGNLMIAENEDIYVSLNYKNDFNSVLAYVHEMGHALHAVSNLKYTRLPVLIREAVARVNELVMMEYCVKNGKASTHDFLEWFRAQVIRQLLFYKTEIFFRFQKQGKGVLNEDDISLICHKYRQVLEQFYGSQICNEKVNSYEWFKSPSLSRAYSSFEYAFSVVIAFEMLCALQNNVITLEELLTECISLESLQRMIAVDFRSPDPYKRIIKYYDNLCTLEIARNTI